MDLNDKTPPLKISLFAMRDRWVVSSIYCPINKGLKTKTSDTANLKQKVFNSKNRTEKKRDKGTRHVVLSLE